MSNTENPSIVEVLRKARDTGGLIRITGYRNSSGEVADYTVRLLGSDGYKKLVQASLKMVMNEELAKPELIDVDTWLLAKNEQVESWGKTLEGGHARSFETAIEDVDGLYGRNNAEPETVWLHNLELVDKKTISVGDKKEVNSRPKTLAKNYIRDNVPLKTYLGQMVLKPGKFDSVSNVGE